MSLTRCSTGGAVAAANHLAASAGVAMLERGGSAVDAAVAAAAVMAVTSPHMCGLGGDLFALVIEPGEVPVALNASGRAGSGADAGALRARGLERMAFQGDIHSATVPGCVDGLVALGDRFGSLSLTELLAPALRLCEDGFPVSPTLAVDSHGLSPETRLLAFGGRAPLRRGQRLRAPALATVLRAIIADGRAGFYEGSAGRELCAAGKGLFEHADLRAVAAEWVDPLSVDAFGHTLWTAPPNSQGYLALSGAWIADAVGTPEDPSSPGWAAVLVEASRQAAFDRPDVLHEHADGRDLLSSERLAARARAIGDRAATGLADVYASGDTTYLCAVDADGAGVSLIMSNGADFGSQVLLPDAGIFLHNRGIGFSLVEGHAAEYGPRRRPPHTLTPVAVTADGALRAVLGTMGGDAQPQIDLQLLARRLVAGQDPGEVVSAPRWLLTREPTNGFDTWNREEPPIVRLEPEAPAAWAEELRARGYEVSRAAPGDQSFGHAQMIAVSPEGMLAGAADPRSADGACVGR
jgi:gamma-glutamyltranspeptidase / glutathione hydrolase